MGSSLHFLAGTSRISCFRFSLYAGRSLIQTGNDIEPHPMVPRLQASPKAGLQSLLCKNSHGAFRNILNRHGAIRVDRGLQFRPFPFKVLRENHFVDILDFEYRSAGNVGVHIEEIPCGHVLRSHFRQGFLCIDKCLPCFQGQLVIVRGGVKRVIIGSEQAAVQLRLHWSWEQWDCWPWE